MEDRWVKRDLPVLDAVVRLLDEPGTWEVTVRDIAADTGLAQDDVVRALDALDGAFLEFEQFTTGGGPDPGPWAVRRVTPGARRAVGMWPTPESLVDRLAGAFAAAAEREPDPKRKARLREVASFLGETGRKLAAEVIATVIARQTGMG